MFKGTNRIKILSCTANFVRIEMYSKFFLIFTFICIHAQALEDVDDFAETITLGFLKPRLDKSEIKTVGCFEQQNSNYTTFKHLFADDLKVFEKEVNKFLQNRFPNWKNRIQGGIQKMKQSMLKYPPLIKKSLQRIKLENAADLIKKFTKAVKNGDEVITNGIKKLKNLGKEEANERANKLENRYQGIRGKAHKAAKEIQEAFKVCFDGPDRIPGLFYPQDTFSMFLLEK